MGFREVSVMEVKEVLRACVDGPAMNAGRILWDRWGVQEAESTPPEGFPALAGWPG